VAPPNGKSTWRDLPPVNCEFQSNAKGYSHKSASKNNLTLPKRASTWDLMQSRQPAVNKCIAGCLPRYSGQGQNVFILNSKLSFEVKIETKDSTIAIFPRRKLIKTE